MKKVPTAYSVIVVVAIFLIWSCAGSAPERMNDPGGNSPETTPVEPIFVGLVDHGLGTRGFRELPAEVRDYLRTLAEAFRMKDADFLASQGETQYETDLKSCYDIETYLAMLYRTGPYADDLPWEELEIPRLDWQQLRGIEYLSWETQGPLLEIKARLIALGGETIPCEIWLLWRLTSPKIQGAYP